MLLIYFQCSNEQIHVKFVAISIGIIYRIIRAVATAPEKTPTEKAKFSELRDNHQSIPRQILPYKKKEKLPPLIYTVQV